MGEHEFEQKALTKAIDTVLQEQSNGAQELRLATPGGRFQVRWDEGGSATALGQLPFTLLHAGGQVRATALFHLVQLPLYLVAANSIL